MFSVGLPWDYISGTELNQISCREDENKNEVSPQPSRKKGLAEDWLCVIVTDCDYEWLYKKVLINPIQNPLLLVMEP
jgi:hypothetical protein